MHIYIYIFDANIIYIYIDEYIGKFDSWKNSNKKQ